MAAAALRDEPVDRNLVVDDESDVCDAIDFGVPGSIFLEKPFTPDELVRAVRPLVGGND